MHLQLILFTALCSFLGAGADTHPDNFMITLDNDLRRVFGKRKVTDDKSKKHKKVQEVASTTSPLEDYEKAEEKIFKTVEKVEKKAFGIAESLLHDEVDILFGKDHGQAIHDDRTIKTAKPVASKKPALVPVKKAGRNPITMKKDESKKLQDKGDLPNSSFLDFMETYARDATQSM